MTHPILRVEALERRTVPATLPPGFAESVLAAGLTAPTGMAVAPDGRVFVAEQAGALRVIRDGALRPTPFVTLAVDPARERGLIGIALDPAFAANGFVYLYHTVPAAGGRAPFNRITRFTAAGDVAAAGSRADLLDLDPLSAAGNHNGGPMQFGPDGKLYVAVGDNANPANSQSLGTRLGKVLRLNPDGSVPADNPTTFDRLGSVPAPTAVWAAGLRNPFALAFEPGTGRLLINDVGQLTYEEVNAGRAGANYGWNLTEGPEPAGVSGVTYPVYSYPHSGPQPFAGDAVTGGAFLGGAGFPAGYYFADYANRWVNRLDPATGTVTNFATDLVGGEVVDLDVGPAGELLYLSRETGAVHRIVAASPPAVPPPPVIAVGTGAGTASAARLVDAAGATRLAAAAFGGGFTGGVRVAAADVTGDGVADLVVGAGPGGGPRVTVLDGATGNPARDFFAFGGGFGGGVFVAAADFDRDGFADIVVTPDVGGGPRVLVVSGRDGSTLASFLGIDDANFRGGARAAAGDLDGDGVPELVVAAGAGGGPRVAVFRGTSIGPGRTPTRLMNDFFAFEPALRDGVYLAVGDVDGDRLGDLVVGAGPGGGPRVLVFSGRTLPTAGAAGSVVASFFAGDPADRSGVPVAARDVDGDGRAEVVAGSAGRVRLYRVAAGGATAAGDFLAFDGVTGGVFVG